MRKQFKTKLELFDYLMYGYAYQLEKVPTKLGSQRRLKDNQLEQDLKDSTKQLVEANNLLVELKLGPAYNRSESPWIKLGTPENKSGAKGRYVGISFNKKTGGIELWIRFSEELLKSNQRF